MDPALVEGHSFKQAIQSLAALREGGEAELERLATGDERGVDRLVVVTGEDVVGDLDADLADTLVQLRDGAGEAGAFGLDIVGLGQRCYRLVDWMEIRCERTQLQGLGRTFRGLVG